MKTKIYEVIIGVCGVLLAMVLIATPAVSAMISKCWFLVPLVIIMIPCALEMLGQTFEYIKTIERKRRDNNDGE